MYSPTNLNKEGNSYVFYHDSCLIGDITDDKNCCWSITILWVCIISTLVIRGSSDNKNIFLSLPVVTDIIFRSQKIYICRLSIYVLNIYIQCIQVEFFKLIVIFSSFLKTETNRRFLCGYLKLTMRIINLQMIMKLDVMACSAWPAIAFLNKYLDFSSLRKYFKLQIKMNRPIWQGVSIILIYLYLQLVILELSKIFNNST